MRQRLGGGGVMAAGAADVVAVCVAAAGVAVAGLARAAAGAAGAGVAASGEASAAVSEPQSGEDGKLPGIFGHGHGSLT